MINTTRKGRTMITPAYLADMIKRAQEKQSAAERTGLARRPSSKRDDR
jgi:hypothetical protein